MNPQLFAETIDGNVRLVLCAGSSTALTVTPETAYAFAEDIMRAVIIAKRQRPGQSTRPMCSACWNDVSACTCAAKGGVA